MPPRPAPTPRRISRSASAATATLQERVDELEATLAGLELERNEAVQQAAEYQERALQWEAYATAAEQSGAERDLSLRRVAAELRPHVQEEGEVKPGSEVDSEDALEDVERLVGRLVAASRLHTQSNAELRGRLARATPDSLGHNGVVGS